VSAPALTTSASRAAISRFFAQDKANLPGLAFILICIAFWELYAHTAGSHFTSFASASATFQALAGLLTGGPMLVQLGHTLLVTMIGWIVASVCGFALGLAIGVWRPAWTYSMASVDLLRSIPSISFIPIALLIFGFSLQTELVIVIYVSQWPVLLGTTGGIRSTPQSFMEVARTFRLSPAAAVSKVILPSALPSIIVGLRLSLTLAISLTVVAEMVGNPAGLGFGIVSSQQAIQPAQAFAYLVVIGVLGWTLNFVFVALVRALFRSYGSIV
jgi:ABC-type nitrate/sulfonate/bicarbonate transport system permease component